MSELEPPTALDDVAGGPQRGGGGEALRLMRRRLPIVHGLTPSGPTRRLQWTGVLGEVRRTGCLCRAGSLLPRRSPPLPEPACACAGGVYRVGARDPRLRLGGHREGRSENGREEEWGLRGARCK